MTAVTLRDNQRQLTRQTVLTAVIELVAEGSLDELSVPAVSRRCGVSVATIYRHYPTKNDLLAAAAAEPSRRALAAAAPSLPGDDEFAAFQRAMWNEFSHNLPLLRHQLSSEAGRTMREARLDRSRGQLAGYLRDQGVNPDDAAGQRLIAMLLLVSGSLGLVELHDRQGLSVDQSIDASLWATRTLLNATRDSVPADPIARRQPRTKKKRVTR